MSTETPLRRRTKIVCTMGPATQVPGVIERLIAAGMDCARLNMSHGSQADHLAMAEHLRKAAHEAGRPLAILADLQGPKIRVGKFPEGPIELVPGTEFRLSGSRLECNSERAHVSYPYLSEDLKPGEAILLDDGLLQMRVVRIEGEDVVCIVEIGGRLSDRKGVNLPGAELRIPALTEKDRADLEFAVKELHADYLALSFVRKPEDILEAQALAQGTPVIAKLEKPDALTNLEAILDVADGAMVARGDLGVELGSEKVPMAQKRIIAESNRRGKLVITATQMLDSMIRNPRQTRAEAADVANAVLDGTDAVMLSGETAAGVYPIESVQMMDAIVREAEGAPIFSTALPESVLVQGGWEFASAAARSAALLSHILPLSAVVVVTRTGKSAELLSGYRPRKPIHAITWEEPTFRRLALRWGVESHLVLPVTTLDDAHDVASRSLRKAGIEPRSEYALVTASHADKQTNMVVLRHVDA
mgnify:CR=1 FL=1